MNGELAQAVALVAHGNAALHGLEDVRALEASNSTFQYVRSLELGVRRGWRTTSVHSVAEWTEEVRGTVDRLWLLRGNANPVAGSNQGGWRILGQGPRRASAWSGHWSVNHAGVDRGDPQPRIWEVAYRLSAHGPRPRVPSIDVPRRTDELRTALRETAEFARGDQALADFAESFDEARAIGDSDDPRAPYHDDMLPSVGYSLEARRLLAMATGAWVFGGMGSWNDVFIPEPERADEYRTVTAQLYRAVIDGISDAANSFQTGSAP